MEKAKRLPKTKIAASQRVCAYLTRIACQDPQIGSQMTYDVRDEAGNMRPGDIDVSRHLIEMVDNIESWYDEGYDIPDILRGDIDKLAQFLCAIVMTGSYQSHDKRLLFMALHQAIGSMSNLAQRSRYRQRYADSGSMRLLRIISAAHGKHMSDRDLSDEVIALRKDVDNLYAPDGEAWSRSFPPHLKRRYPQRSTVPANPTTQVVTWGWGG